MSQEKIQLTLGETESAQVDRFLYLLKRFIQAYETRRLIVVTGGQVSFPGLKLFQGDEPMPTYTLPRDHADEPFVLGPLSFNDSEGPVPAPEFTESFDSDNTDVVSVDAAAATLHFGTLGGANVSRKVTIGGNEFIVFTATFNLTPGALVISGDVSFPNLTPDA